MRLIIWVKGERGIACLRALLDSGQPPSLVVLQNQPSTGWFCSIMDLAQRHGLPTFAPEDPNHPDSLHRLRAENPDLFVLAGYGRILAPQALAIPRLMSLNLHGGRLPQQRGSSPMNWVLIKGDTEAGISILRLDAGVDTGDVLNERIFPVGPQDTIADLHALANRVFPEMLLETLAALRNGELTARPQDPDSAAYYPVRFPEDGLLLFDQHSAEQAHNRIRSLAPPYPGAYTYWRGRRVALLGSRPHPGRFHGEPGRIYLIRGQELLVCALDRCLWITSARLTDTDTPLAKSVRRYDRLATVREAAERVYLDWGRSPQGD